MNTRYQSYEEREAWFAEAMKAAYTTNRADRTAALDKLLAERSPRRSPAMVAAMAWTKELLIVATLVAAVVAVLA